MTGAAINPGVTRDLYVLLGEPVEGYALPMAHGRANLCVLRD
jgi:hypothetical protein